MYLYLFIYQFTQIKRNGYNQIAPCLYLVAIYITNISDKIRSWYYQLNHKSRHTIQWLARHLIIQHDIFLHMTHFLHISLSAVTCFVYMCGARENIRIFQDIVFQISAVAFATFNIWYLRSFEKTCKKEEIDFSIMSILTI